MSVYQQLVEARAKIADIENWTTGHLYKAATNQYCALGALGIIDSSDTRGYFDAVTLLSDAAIQLSPKLAHFRAGSDISGPVWRLNDARMGYNSQYSDQHNLVLKMYDLAIEAAAKQEGIITTQQFQETAPSLPVDTHEAELVI